MNFFTGVLGTIGKTAQYYLGTNSISNRTSIEEVITEKSSLIGMTLDDSIDVSGLSFASVRIDKNGLAWLIQKEADLKGVDLSNQDLSGMDLSGLDLTRANLTNTNLSHTSLIDTNLSGTQCIRTNFSSTVFGKTIFVGARLVGVTFDPAAQHNLEMGGVIIEPCDSLPYVDDLRMKLRFILYDDAQGKNYDDPFYALLPTNRITALREAIQFKLTENSLRLGFTDHDGGPQNICVENGQFDLRQINKDGLTDQQISDTADFAVEQLLGDGFTVAQKTLFHRARSIMWTAIGLNKYTMFQITNPGAALLSEETSNHVFNALVNDEAIKQIFIMGGMNKPRVVSLLAEVCFYNALPLVLKDFPELTYEQKQDVYSLFMSPVFCW